MKKSQAEALQVGDTVYFTTKAYGFTLRAVICHEHLPDRLRRGLTAVKVIEPFEKRFIRVETKKLFISKEAAEVAARMQR